jgi:uncharacterized protein YjdB
MALITKDQYDGKFKKGQPIQIVAANFSEAAAALQEYFNMQPDAATTLVKITSLQLSKENVQVNEPGIGENVTGIMVTTPSNKTLTLMSSSSTQIVAEVTPTSALNKNLKYISTNPTVATVSADGTVTGNAAGNAIIVIISVDQEVTEMVNVTVT